MIETFEARSDRLQQARDVDAFFLPSKSLLWYSYWQRGRIVETDDGKRRLIRGAGGYFKLDSWVLANIVQLATQCFCRKFLTLRNDPCGRQYDQMTQAARSGTANIAEGSARHYTSTETEMTLTDVARASFQELSGDYLNWLLQKGELPWGKDSVQAREIYALRLSPADYGPDIQRDACARILAERQKFAKWLDSDDSSVRANALLILIARVCNMLNRQLENREDSFREQGGFRENLTRIRLEDRDAAQAAEGAPQCPKCGAPMRKMVAKRGRNAGNAFWSCTKYPDCSGTRRIEL